MDASEYIKELKQKVVRLNQEIAREEDTHSHEQQNTFPTVHTATPYILLYLHIVVAGV